MKKIKLLLAALAAMTAGSLFAQTDAEYAAANAEIQANGVYKIYTLSNGTGTGQTKYYLKSDGYLTDDASAAGQFTFDFQRIFGGFKMGGYRINRFTNGGNQDNSFSGDALKKIVTSANNNREDWEAQVFFKNADGFAVRSTNAVSTNWGASAFWTVVADNDEDGLPNATYTIEAVPYVWQLEKVTDGDWSDVTAKYITNYNPVANADGWTATNGYRLYDWASNPITFDSGNNCAEMWSNQSASIKQTLQNLPAGYYELTAIAYTREGMTSTLFAGESNMPIATVSSSTVDNRSQANTWFNNGNGSNALKFAVTQDNTNIEIGLITGTSGDAWTVWRAFYLTYTDKVPDADIADLVATIPTSIPTAVKDNLNNLANTLQSDKSLIAYSNLQVAIGEANGLTANYSRYQAIKTAALVVAPSTSTTDADNAVNAATNNDAIVAAIATLRAAFLAELPNVEIPVDPGYIDVTAVMVENASVRQNTNYWTAEEIPGGVRTGNSWAVCNYEECEFYQQNFKFYQTLALSKGSWEFGVTGFHRAGNHSTYFYAGGSKVLIPGVESSVVNDMAGAKTYFDNGNGKVSVKFALDAAGNVEIGIENKDTETDKWTIFRDFTLKYYGEAVDLTPYKNALAKAVLAANAIQSSVPAAVYSALQDVVTTNNKEYTSVAEYETATSNIEAATNNAKAIAVPYTEYNAVKAKVEAMKGVEGYTETTGGATSTLTSAISTADTEVAAATSAEVIANQVVAVKAAAKTFLAGVRSDGEHAFDITFLITNPGFDNNNVDGWTKTKGNPTTRMHCNEFYQTEFDFNQTLNDMPKGNYELKVQAFQRPGWAEAVYAGYLAGTSKATSVIYINEGTTTINHFGAGVVDNTFGYTLGKNGSTFIRKDGGEEDYMSGYDVKVLDNNGTTMYGPQMMETAEVWFDNNMYDNSVLTAVEGELKLGFKSTAAAVDGDWTIFDNFRLYYYGQSINVAMDEAQAFSALADIEGANITMARTSKVGYNTVALPFDLTEAQVKEVFGDEAEVYSYSDEGDANNTTVNFNKTTTAITANVPVLVKATKAATEIKVDNVTVKTGAAKVEGTNYDFVGNYGGKITLAEGIWFVGNDALYKSAGNTNMKGFRAFLQAKEEVGGEVKLFIGGIETAISEINGAAVENGAIYNLAGQRVSKAQKGVFIVNGKKVIVK